MGFQVHGRGIHSDDVRHCRLAAGDRAGLIQHHHLDPARAFQRFAVLEKDAVLRALGRAHHDRGRRSQAERARARDHQHSHRVDHRARPIGAGQQQPASERHQRNDNHDGHKIAADPVGQFLDGRLAALGLLDHAHDLGQGRVLAHLARLEPDQPFLVDRRTDDLVAGSFAHRHRFTGEHRLIEGRTPIADDAVHGNFLARPHEKGIAHDNLVHIDLALNAVADDMRGSGTQAHQCFQRFGRLAACARASRNLPSMMSVIIAAPVSK